MDEKLLQMSATIHSNPGVYALLLGSGISYPAKIPTGWQLMEKLILKIAAVHGESPEDPIEWYKTQFQKAARYDEVIQKLGATSADRNAILRPEFELQGDEGESDPELKRPTKAHRAIASLIKRGYFNVVLTTNFDRLLEQALEAEGVNPNVVSTDTTLEGARPPQHSKITIYKIHGDYLDDDFRNIDSELGDYPEVWKTHIDRILDEYGLIICGWSAEWDRALRNRFEAAKSRRYTIFWSAYPEPTPEANQLIDHRGANVIEGKTADELFSELDANISALEQFNRPSPISVAVAIERVKRLIPDENKYIELEDFVKQEVIEAYEKFHTYDFQPMHRDYPNIAIENMLEHYFHRCEIPLNILTTLTWYGKPSQRDLVKFSIEQWAANFDNISGVYDLIPDIFLVYSTGITSLHRENWTYFSTSLTEAGYVRRHSNPYRYELVLTKLIPQFINYESEYRVFTGNHIKQLVKALLKPYIFEPNLFDNTFDLIEMLYSLVISDINEMGKIYTTQDKYGLHEMSYGYLSEFWFNAGKLGQEWGLLKVSGLFEGDINRLYDLLVKYDDAFIDTFHFNESQTYAKSYLKGLSEGRHTLIPRPPE